jgi:hypothetical protein
VPQQCFPFSSDDDKLLFGLQWQRPQGLFAAVLQDQGDRFLQAR